MALPQPPLVHRRSRDSLRTIPSPKPAPSVNLPRAPASASSSDTFSSASTPEPATPHASRTPASALGLTDLDSARPLSAYSAAPSSVASPRRRLASRTHALALLEGRDASRVPKPRARNFMSMSDDEDDAADDADVEDADDAPAPTPARTPSPASAVSAPALTLSFLPMTKARSLSTASLPASVKSRGTGGRNFIDLRADWDAEDEQRSFSFAPQRALDLGHWRSFIEIEIAGGA